MIIIIVVIDNLGMMITMMMMGKMIAIITMVMRKMITMITMVMEKMITMIMNHDGNE